MKINLVFLFALSLFAVNVTVRAQNPASSGQEMQHHRMQPGTPGMQHYNVPGMQASPASQGSTNPAQVTGAGPQTPAPDLLKDVAKKPAMQLSQFEQFALATNPTLQQANALVRQSAGQARQIGLLPNPSVGYQGEQIRGGSYRGGEQGAFLQQTFVLGGKLGLRRNVFEQQRKEDEIGATEQRYRVLSDVQQSYYITLAAQELVHVRQRLLGLAMDAVETVHQLANVGQADAPDVLQAEVEAEQAKVDYTTAQRTFIQEFRTLAALVGKPELPLSPLAGNLENPPAINPEQIVNQIVQESPSVKRAQQDIAHAEAEIKSAKRESIPDLTVRAGVEQNFEPINEISTTPVGLQSFVTAGVTLPLFNRNQGNVRAAEADRERAKAEVTRVELSLRQSTQPLLQGYLSELAQANRYKNEMIPRATRAYQLYLVKYQQMGAAYPQVIVSQRTLFQLQAGYITVLQNVWSNAIALQNYTLSGGLNPAMPSGSMSTTLNLPSSGAGGAAQ
ncbi:MAG TPA: TolC family protein [Terriglobales bacterium]|nr:TolC family protein [Terriglobales bacterium]